MSVKERIISIQIIEMIQKTPKYADKIGIKGEMIDLESTNKSKADNKK